MNNNSVILKYSFLGGAIYFVCVSIAHALSIKVPGLFIYYNIPSNQYQDSIISFLAFGWAAFFYSGAQNLNFVKPVLLSSIVALMSLANINISTNFSEISDGITTTPFWAQFTLLCFYIGWLMLFSFKVQTENESNTNK